MGINRVIDHTKTSKRSNKTSERFDQMDDYIQIVIDLYYKAYTREIVYEYLTSVLKLPPTTANGVLDSAMRKIKDDFDIDKQYILNLHIKRYDILATYCESIKVTNRENIFEINRKFDSLITWLESLSQKERLLGFHTKTFKVKFKNYVESKNKEKKSYDFSKLSIDELLQINEFLSKTDDQRFMIRKKEEKQEIEVVDNSMIIEESPLRQEVEIKPKVNLIKTNVKDINKERPKETNLEEIRMKILQKSKG